MAEEVKSSSDSLSGIKPAPEVTECPLCGSNHDIDHCPDLRIQTHISDKSIPSRARLSLPEDFYLKSLVNGGHSIFTKKLILKGTKFGPLKAKKSITLNPVISFPIKQFSWGEDYLEYYLDTSSENDCNWMMFVEPAEYFDEQNLICFQENDNIYFATIKDVNENECLKVWYAPYYAQKMRVQLLAKENIHKEKENSLSQSDVNELVKSKQKIINRDQWTCKFCGAIISQVTDFAQHILEHYENQLKKTCEVCKATFKSRQSFKKHMNIVHHPSIRNMKSPPAINPAKIKKKASKEASGDPLLYNSHSIDNCDDSNLLLPSFEHMQDLGSIAADNSTYDNLLLTDNENVKTIDYFNFELGETKDEFVCDICVKSFLKLRYLIQHLRGHTGEYHCSICKKVFTRLESKKNHLCEKTPIYSCKVCGHKFGQRKTYNKHLRLAHKKNFKCIACKRSYSTNFELKRHACRAKMDVWQRHPCEKCNKVFLRVEYLRKHMKSHDSSKIEKNFVCSICGKKYISQFVLNLHVKTHGERDIQCDICDKKFYLKYHYQSHLLIHLNQEHKCNICSKKFHRKHNLNIHKRVHENPKYECTICNQKLRTRGTLRNHVKIHEKNVDSDESLPHVCPHCNKRMKLKSSVVRHISKKHPEKESDSARKPPKKFKKTEELPDESKHSFLNTNELDFMSNSKDNIDLINDDMNQLDGNFQLQMIDNIVLNTTKEMGIELNDHDILDLNNIEINVAKKFENKEPEISSKKNEPLSMPDLLDNDQELDENRYIFESNASMDPQKNSDNIVVLVLNPDLKCSSSY